MKSEWLRPAPVILALFVLCMSNAALLQAGESAKPVVDIGDRVELFVDAWLIQQKQGVSLRLTPPVKREVVLTLDKPWEAPHSAYFTVFQDGGRVRMYYRGTQVDDQDQNQTTCYAESMDGIHFTRPNLGLYEWNGSKDNNIVFIGPESAAFAPFLDANPAAKPNEKYKAIGYKVINGSVGGVMALASPDGLRWTRLQDEPILPTGSFDSLNTAFWDPQAKLYRLYGRYWTGGGFTGVRGILSSTSPDFRNWSAPKPNVYADGVPLEHFYTNATIRCPGAEHLLLSFPKRFLPDRKKVVDHPHPGVSDAVFMSSRDGLHWDRTFLEAWVRPGLDERNWTDRNNMPAWGIIQTDPSEFTMYISEHYQWPTNRLRRLTIRRHGFASVHADHEGGDFTTRPVTFSGKHLILNYSTSAAGLIRVEIQDERGRPLPGFALADMQPLYGDDLDGVVTWKGGSDLSALAGKPVRFHFVLKDADLYAIRTGEVSKTTYLEQHE